MCRSGVVDVLFYTRCGGYLVWWMSSVVDVWCDGCPVWWMSGVVDVLFYTWCGGCLLWWMSGVVDVCVVDVVQSTYITSRVSSDAEKQCLLMLKTPDCHLKSPLPADGAC